jgi:hypothetical protein
VSKKLGISRVVLSSMELVSDIEQGPGLLQTTTAVVHVLYNGKTQSDELSITNFKPRECAAS